MEEAGVSTTDSIGDVTRKVTPRSPYVEDETDEEFRPDTPASDVDTNERMCRICFSGYEEVATQGKLISPCKCRCYAIRTLILRGVVAR